MKSALLILQVTDLHFLAQSNQIKSGVNTEQSFGRVMESAKKNYGNADLLLVTGDLAQQPCQSSYQRIYNVLKKYQFKSLCLPGNHDDLALMQQFINTKQINCNKQISYKYWQIICLNSKKEGSESGYITDEELLYLKEILNKHPNLYTLIAIHHHPIPINSSWMDKMIIENSEKLFSLLSDYPKVKAITCGHIHQQLDTKKDTKLIFGTPSTCFQYKPYSAEYALDDKEPGYRVFWLYPDGAIKSKIVRLPLS